MRTKVFCADRQTERRTDITKLIVAFRNFAKTPKKGKVCKFKEAEEVKFGQTYVWSDSLLVRLTPVLKLRT
jgi:hypothetical protein